MDTLLNSKFTPVIALVPDSSTEIHNPEEIPNLELFQSLAVADHPTPHLLSIPAPAVNDSRSSFALSDSTDHSSAFDPLSPEITSADIAVAREYGNILDRVTFLTSTSPADGSFVETSSGLAARELKKRWDQEIGVGKDVRSPYAITAFVNQHGKSMFRVGCVALAYE